MRLEYHAVTPPPPPKKKNFLKINQSINQQTVLQQKATVLVSNWLPAIINKSTDA